MNREKIITEATSWLGTPWHHQGKIKHVGVDCGYFLLEVFANVGLVERSFIEPYPRDWATHKNDERFLEVVERYAHKTDTSQAGDIAVFKYGRTFSHGAIIIDLPRLIHAQIKQGVVYAKTTDAELAGRDVKFFTVF